MELAFAWWMIPALITLLSGIFIFLPADPGDGLFKSVLVQGFQGLLAIIVAIIAWLIYFIIV
jgi:hypothetical protein